jgi:hypothetical protein
VSSLTAQMRKLQAGQRRRDRECRKRQKELERQMKESEKLSELEQARLEVATHENELEVLLSIHKEQSAPIEWTSFASALPPHEPLRSRRHEFVAMLKNGIAELSDYAERGNATAEDARALDEREYQALRENYEAEIVEWKRMCTLAKRVLVGDAGAYSEAISEFSSLSEIAHLGSSIHIRVYSPKLIECTLTVNGREAIPAEMKSLTAAGKLSVKAMPQARFHEIYQDYVCSCVLRVAREMLALLPIDEVLVTASVNAIDARTGKRAELPVLSAAMARKVIQQLDFERLDPSDSMENFSHRGDVMASRKGGEFLPIIPLKPADLAPAEPERMDFTGLLTSVRQLRGEITSKLKPLPPPPDENAAKSFPV